MTDIEIRQAAAPDQATPGVDLRVWAEQATSAAVYAQAVCATSMVPTAYRGKPAEATAAILAGAELGFSPMASLRAFDNISGTPAPKAMTLRAIVQAAGHEVCIVESTDDRAEVHGRRKGNEQWEVSVWDVSRAQQLAQWDSNKNYKTNRAQMLCARATAEVCRWIAADAIMGMPYAAEELDRPAAEATPTVRRLTAADLTAPAIEASPDDGEPLGDDQRRHMFALWSELGYDTSSEADRVTRLAVSAKICGLESLESSSDLTRAQADRVIAALRERKDRTAVPAGDAS